MTQTVTPVPSAAGTRLNYAITVTNGGPLPAVGVTLLPGVPLGATAVTASTDPGRVHAQCGDMELCARQARGRLSPFVPTSPSSRRVTGSLFTTASVTSQTPDTVIANNFHTIAATILPAGQGVDLALTKADSIDPVGVNATVHLHVDRRELTARPSRPTCWSPTTCPAGITITYATSAQGMCSAISSQVLCSFASLAPGESVTMTFNAVGTAVGVVTNQASVTSAEPELTPADNVATQMTVIVTDATCSAATFSGPFAYATGGGMVNVVKLADVNHDGRLDAVIGHQVFTNLVTVLPGYGRWRLWRADQHHLADDRVRRLA